MQLQQTQALKQTFLNFAHEASNILHINTDKDYADALEMVEKLFEEAVDNKDEPLNDLIDLISRAIEKYELSQEQIILFEKEAENNSQEISILKTLMEQHQLSISDFKDEIGSKSLVSMILNGQRNLTKQHISKLSIRFNINPSLFFII